MKVLVDVYKKNSSWQKTILHNIPQRPILNAHGVESNRDTTTFIGERHKRYKLLEEMEIILNEDAQDAVFHRSLEGEKKRARKHRYSRETRNAERVAIQSNKSQ